LDSQTLREGFTDHTGQALASVGDGLDHGDAEQFGEPPFVDLDPLSLGLVHHVEDQHHRFAQLEQFQGQLEASAEQRGIDHVHHHIDPLLDQEPPCLPLGRVGGPEGVGSRQVDALTLQAIYVELAHGVLHGGAGEVGDDGLVAAQVVEDGALATVGLADQHYPQSAASTTTTL